MVEVVCAVDAAVGWLGRVAESFAVLARPSAGAVRDGLDVELVVRVDFLDDACADLQDFEHAAGGTAEDDDG